MEYLLIAGAGLLAVIMVTGVTIISGATVVAAIWASGVVII
jgi:hypothetical protein